MNIYNYMWILLLGLTSCAPALHHLDTPSLAAPMAQNKTIHDHVATAQVNVASALQLSLLHPDIAIKLRQAQTELTAAQDTILQQNAALTASQKQITTVTVAGNKALTDRDYWHEKAGLADGLVWKWRLFFVVSFIGNILLVTFMVAIRFFKTYLMTVPVVGPILASLL